MLATVRDARDSLEREARFERQKQAVLDTARRFRAAAMLALDLVYEYDDRTGELEWFGNIQAALGHEPSDVPKALEEWLPLIHPDDVEGVIAAAKRLLG